MADEKKWMLRVQGSTKNYSVGNRAIVLAAARSLLEQTAQVIIITSGLTNQREYLLVSRVDNNGFSVISLGNRDAVPLPHSQKEKIERVLAS